MTTPNHDGSAYVRELEEFRREKDAFFAHSPQSPIPHELRHGAFSGLSYYPPDQAFRVTATLTPFAQRATVTLATSTGEPRQQVRYGELRFVIGTTELRLAAFTEPRERVIRELFIPFRDATSGHETYGAGRYLEVEVEPNDETVTLDFNLAYNPYCAYNEAYTCPIPPAENTLPIAIAAGERIWDEH
jgi:uncharacterized protein